jgi:hypothetical protein
MQLFHIGARGSVVVKALCCKPEGREFDEVNFFFSSNYLILQVALGPGVFTQPLTEMSTRSRKIMFLGSRARPVHGADNLIAICEPIVETM